ncbi:hypothetical protein HMPREF1222_02166 [Treponema vincentii F0403]|uniref:Uncharacterized protein n=1 Tax=Treponema vincentii F0403 TaxID=1125702 RepID=S3L9J4_9SPIR|nr:hypothetical protein [Treponema vincentii]EPF46076.1 hypothetical protein HMPREF1222_02166 [Treponema vincentii F0403]
MLHLEKVNGKNVWEITKLHISETQKDLLLQMMQILLAVIIFQEFQFSNP